MPKRTRAKTRSEAVLLDVPEKRRRTAPAALVPHQTAEAKAARDMARVKSISLSSSYRHALAVEVEEDEILDYQNERRGTSQNDRQSQNGTGGSRQSQNETDTGPELLPDKLQHVILQGIKAGKNGKLSVSDVLAAALVRRASDPRGKDGVLAIRELADRTEGPVVQQTASASVSYVVSVTPGGALGSGSMNPSTPEQWEALARADWQAAQPLPPLLDEAQVRIAQGSTGPRR
jgi:hypothetical protein